MSYSAYRVIHGASKILIRPSLKGKPEPIEAGPRICGHSAPGGAAVAGTRYPGGRSSMAHRACV